MPAVTGTYVWIFLFDPRNGPVMRVMDSLGLADPDTTNWFNDRLSFYAIATLNVVHHGFPFVAITILAGLVTLPQETLEAATMDGANSWQRFWHVTVPLMRPVIVAAVLLRGIDALKTFDILYATKGKGGGAFHDVETLNVYAYGLSFDYNEYGLASAVLILFFLMILAVIWILQMQRKARS